MTATFKEDKVTATLKEGKVPAILKEDKVMATLKGSAGWTESMISTRRVGA